MRDLINQFSPKSATHGSTSAPESITNPQVKPEIPPSLSKSSIKPPKREKAPKQEYIGNADKFIISKLNRSDLKRFQKDGFDLTSIGFEGWTVKQTQKDGKSSFQLKHVSGIEHTNISTPTEVQEILRPSDAPVIMAPVSAVEALVPRIASKPIEALLNRQAFL